MKRSPAYQEILDWQREHNIFIGDQICFLHKGKKRTGYLTGFEMHEVPHKLIVRYISRMGFLQIIAIDTSDVLCDNNIMEVV